jgi:hypothetical protein
MVTSSHSESPTILLRVSDGTFHMHRSFGDFAQAQRSAEAYAGAGFRVAMISATGRFLMAFATSGSRSDAGPRAGWPRPLNFRVPGASCPEILGIRGENRGFLLVLLELYGIIVENDLQEPRSSSSGGETDWFVRGEAAISTGG